MQWLNVQKRIVPWLVLFGAVFCVVRRRGGDERNAMAVGRSGSR